MKACSKEMMLLLVLSVETFGQTSFGSVSQNAGTAEVTNDPAALSAKVNKSISGNVRGSAATLTLSGPSSASTTTDGSGNYSFSGLRNGTYVVAPSRSGYSFTPSTASVTIKGGSVVDINFTATSLPPTYSISGNVSGTAATLTLSGASSASTTTNGAGSYSFPGLQKGSYTVTPSQAGYSFTPASAAVSINSSPISGINFTGAAVPHTVSLNWTASTSSNIAGYNLYRGTVSGGPYAKLNTAPVAATSYVDASVASGKTYFYVATTVDSSNKESVYSTQAAAAVPTP